jgi:hypothetical protein
MKPRFWVILAVSATLVVGVILTVVIGLVLISRSSDDATSGVGGDPSDPLVVSGSIAPGRHGESLFVALYRGRSHRDPPANPLVEITSYDGGQYALHAAMSLETARQVYLYIEPYRALVPPLTCGYVKNLPALVLANGQWVKRDTGRPVVISVDLAEVTC